MENEKYQLNQVSVRLRLQEEAPLYSTKQIDTPDRAVEVMKDMMKQLDREYVCVVNLDASSCPINFNVVSMGTINASPVCMRELLKSGILANAAGILLLHNHPSSSITPSKMDHITTARVMLAAESMGFNFVDHVIVGGGTGQIFSYKKELGSMFNIKGMDTFLRMNGINLGVAEPLVAYQTDQYNKTDLGPKRIVENEKSGGNAAEKKDVVAEFRAETERHFQEICGMTAGEIETFIKAEAQEIINDYDMDIQIVDAVISGSRSRGLENDGSDLDVVLEYTGNEKEDAVFGALNEEKLVLGGIRVDINPITEGQTGTLEEYLPKAGQHLAEKAREYKPLTKVEEIEEENYNQIDICRKEGPALAGGSLATYRASARTSDNYLSNTKPKVEEIREKRQEEADRIKRLPDKDRPSLLARMREKKAIVDARKAEQGVSERRSSKVERTV